MNEKTERDGNNFEWDFVAKSSEELAHIGSKLINKASKRKFIEEQWQMSRFLQAMSSSSIFKFPIRVQHTGVNGVPDFQVESDEQRIAIELARVSTQDLECGRFLQSRVKRTMDITSLLCEKEKPRTEDEIIATAFARRPLIFGLSNEEQEKIWLEKVTTQLNEKTAVLQGKQFEHGHEDWLVLWDRIGTSEFEIKSRIKVIKSLLASRWKSDWYSRVFIQQIEPPQFLAGFSEAEFVSIPKDFEMPTHNYPPGFVFEVHMATD